MTRAAECRARLSTPSEALASLCIETIANEGALCCGPFSSLEELRDTQSSGEENSLSSFYEKKKTLKTHSAKQLRDIFLSYLC